MAYDKFTKDILKGRVKISSFVVEKKKVEAQPITQPLEEGLKLLQVHGDKNGNHAKVYRDSEFDEHRVKFFKDGKHLKNADYHTDNVEDAHGTAKAELKRMNESTTMDTLAKKFYDKKIQIAESTSFDYKITKDITVSNEGPVITLEGTNIPSKLKLLESDFVAVEGPFSLTHRIADRDGYRWSVYTVDGQYRIRELGQVNEQATAKLKRFLEG